VTTRNKYLRCEKLFTAFDLESGRFLTTRGTPGNTGLQELAVPLVQQVWQQGRPRSLHALFDAGAGKSDAGTRALWEVIGWLVALVYNAVADLAQQLGADFAGEHVRTRRRQFFNRPGQLYETPEALIVYLDPFAGQEALMPVIDRLNNSTVSLKSVDQSDEGASVCAVASGRVGPPRCA